MYFVLRFELVGAMVMVLVVRLGHAGILFRDNCSTIASPSPLCIALYHIVSCWSRPRPRPPLRHGILYQSSFDWIKRVASKRPQPSCIFLSPATSTAVNTDAPACCSKLTCNRLFLTFVQFARKFLRIHQYSHLTDFLGSGLVHLS